MSAIAITDDLFFNRAGLDRSRAEHTVADALKGGDDGELFLEFNQSEALSLDDGKLKSASFDVTQGFGLRAVAAEAHAYAHASELSEAALKRAAATVKAIHSGHSGTLAEGPQGTNRHLYSDDNPLAKLDFSAKVEVLQQMDAYARAKDPRVRQVMASISGSWQAVQIIRGDGSRAADIRPLVRLNVSIMVEENGRMETGSHGTGGRFTYELVVDPAHWKASVDEALRQAIVNLGS